jgi:hypothetical protein
VTHTTDKSLIVDGSGAGLLLSQSFVGGPRDGLAVTNDYDAFLRRTASGVSTHPTTLNA